MLPIVIVIAAAVALPAAAQPSSYASLQSREVKALSPEETADLLKGRGMGASMAAELNGYPGPLHVIELADSLQLSVPQRAAAEEMVGRMRTESQALGRDIVGREQALDRTFAAGAAEQSAIAAEAEEIGRLRGRLRAVHLRAHLDMRSILTDAQIQTYAASRGYGDHGDDPAHGPRP